MTDVRAARSYLVEGAVDEADVNGVLSTLLVDEVVDEILGSLP